MITSHLLGNRYISITGTMWMHEMATILDQEFRPLGKLHINLKSWTGNNEGIYMHLKA